jgi:palmitoyltransferase ZDHHC13/17
MIRLLTRLDTFPSAPMLNVIFAVFYGFTGYFYFKTMMENPGYVPKGNSRIQQKATIDELIELRQFDDEHFCVDCMVRRPLRSKHCKRCNRCVAKHDQYVYPLIKTV